MVWPEVSFVTVKVKMRAERVKRVERRSRIVRAKREREGPLPLRFRCLQATKRPKIPSTKPYPAAPLVVWPWSSQRCAGNAPKGMDSFGQLIWYVLTNHF